MRKFLTVCLFVVAFATLVAGESLDECRYRVGNQTQKELRDLMARQMKGAVSNYNAEISRITEKYRQGMLKCAFGADREISDLALKEFAADLPAATESEDKEMDYTRCTMVANQKYNTASQKIGQMFSTKKISNLDFGLGMNDALKVYTAEMQRCKNLK